MKNVIINEGSAASATEVVAAPGILEADAIREDFAAAQEGLRRFVQMGFRLLDVKNRLPHGQYMRWTQGHLPELSQRHLHRAKTLAEGMCEIAGIKMDTRVHFENLPEQILEMVDGATGMRALMTTVHEFRADEAEQAAEARCREFFAGDPDLADEWEPRVLSGEITWCQAVRGIAGHAATAGKRRKETNYGLLLPTTLTTLNNAFRRWETIPESRRAEVAVSLRTMARDWPEDVRQIIRQAI